jgi:hypothetical protein
MARRKSSHNCRGNGFDSDAIHAIPGLRAYRVWSGANARLTTGASRGDPGWMYKTRRMGRICALWAPR